MIATSEYDVVVENEDDPSTILKDLRMKYTNRLIIGHLNVNSIEGKIKLDEFYSTKLFDVEGYTPPFRLDRNINGGGVKEGIPCRELKPKYST